MKNVIAVLLCMFMMIDVSGYAFSAEREGEVTFIVELVGGGMLEKSQNNEKQTEVEIEKLQSKAIKSVEEITGNKVLCVYSEIINGFAINGKSSELERIKAVSNVQAVHISNDIEIDDPVVEGEEYNVEIEDFGEQEDESNEFNLFSVSNESEEYTGKGQVIAIIDTELNYNHNMFAYVPENPKYSKQDIQNLIDTKVLSAEKNHSSLSADDVYISEKIPFVFDYANDDANPYTSNSLNDHGTHVTGITVRKAKDAQILFMKVRRDGESSISFYTMLFALEDAVRLGADVINISLGSLCGFTHEELSGYMLNALENSGICVSVSAGNGGTDAYSKNSSSLPAVDHPDYGTVSKPSIYDCSTSVAASKLGGDIKTMTVNGKAISYLDYVSIFEYEDFNSVIEPGEYSYEYCGIGREEDFNNVDVNGKIALIDRGELYFDEKIQNAKKYGAIAVVFVNTSNSYDIILLSKNKLPSMLITNTDGDILKNYSEKTLTIESSTRKSIANFSSYGCTPDLKIKPEITQNGYQIFSSTYSKINSYNIKSGTSMATPIFSSLVADTFEYLDEKNTEITKVERKDLAEKLLQTSAEIIYEGDVPASPRGQGAGYGSAEKARQISTILTGSKGKVKVELGDKIDNSVSFIVTAKNISDNAVTYDLNTIVTSDWYKTENGNNYVSGRYIWDDAEVEYLVDGEKCNEVAIPANSEKEIEINITLDAPSIDEVSNIFTNGFFVEGYVTLENENEPLLSIPFMGFRGDWAAVPIFTTNDTQSGNGSCMLYTALYAELPYDKATNTYYARPMDTRGVSFFSDNLRNIKAISADVYNDDNVLCMHATAGYLSKKTVDASTLDIPKKYGARIPELDFSFYDSNNKLYRDGIFRYEISAYVDYEGAENTPQLLSYNICLDTTAPTIEDAYIVSNMLYVKPGDLSNTGVAYLLNGQDKIDSIETTLDGYNTFDISSLDLSNCKVGLIDILNNKAEYSFSFGNGYHAEYFDNYLSEVSCFDAVMLGSKLLNAPTTSQNGKIFVWDDAMSPITFN